STTGNSLVIAAIALERYLQNVANYLIASLAVTDLLVAVLVMPLAAKKQVITGVWLLGRAACDAWTSMDVLCCTASILHLVAIALDRYWAVTKVNYVHHRPLKTIVVMIILSWGISAIICLPPLMGWRQNGDQTPFLNCMISQDPVYTIYSTVGAFYLPLVVIIIIYISVYRAAKRRIRKNILNGESSKKSVECVHNNDHRYFKNISNKKERAKKKSKKYDKNVKVEMMKNRHSSFQNILSVLKVKKLSLPTTSATKITSTMSSQQIFHKNVEELSIQNQTTKKNSARERKAARTLAVITGSFVICWLPFFLLALIEPFCGDVCRVPYILASFINWLGYCNSLLNPIIYTVFSGDFRRAFRKILLCR
ncbi:hypothetical protein HELRODRAFT_140496, partial [Helobdella robusta]|uniref:G-protein coupled receptors family 1 profile domain-containing protein n=1 Tax=Helobdella robusta TaxID=6412 RepID=T1EJ13_HELRO